MSGDFSGAEIDLSGINGSPRGLQDGEQGDGRGTEQTGSPTDDGGIAHGALLCGFAEAVMIGPPEQCDRLRDELRTVLTPEAFVDTCAIIGAFNVVDRIADSTGIPLDDMIAEMSEPVREELNLARFASSQNTLGDR